MKFVLSPIVFLALFWLAMSGHYTILILGLGALSCYWIQLISKRMDIIDHEGVPVHLTPWRIVPYWIWLIKEIVLSTWAVSKMILSPNSSISPTVIQLPISGMDDMEKTIYANSITLTPGTLTLEVDKSNIEVHTLRSDMLESLERGDMADRVRRLEFQTDKSAQ